MSNLQDPTELLGMAISCRPSVCKNAARVPIDLSKILGGGFNVQKGVENLAQTLTPHIVGTCEQADGPGLVCERKL